MRQDGDAAISVGSVWIYADTFTAIGLIHSESVDAGRVVAGQLIPNRGSTYYWPNAAVSVPGDRILVTLTAGYAPSNVAAILSTKAHTVRFVRFVVWPSSFVAGLARVGHTIEVYGTGAVNSHTLGRSVYRATVQIRGGRFTDWRYPSAKPLYRAADTTVSVWRRGSTWHLVTLHDGPYGDGTVSELTATSPSLRYARTRTVGHGYTYNPSTTRVHYNVEHHAGGMLTINDNWTDGVLHAARTYAPQRVSPGASSAGGTSPVP